MSEVLYDDYERERTITRAEILHELSNPLNHAQYPVEMVHEQSGRQLLQYLLNGDLSEWTEDILDAFHIDKTRWSERIINPRTGQRIDPAEARFIQGELGATLRSFSVECISKAATQGYGIGDAKFTLELDDHVHVDLCGGGEVWINPANISSELVFSALFRKVA
jgi:hypothetical protein